MSEHENRNFETESAVKNEQQSDEKTSWKIANLFVALLVGVVLASVLLPTLHPSAATVTAHCLVVMGIVALRYLVGAYLQKLRTKGWIVYCLLIIMLPVIFDMLSPWYQKQWAKKHLSDQENQLRTQPGVRNQRHR